MEECEALCDRLAIMVNGQFQVVIVTMMMVLIAMVIMMVTQHIPTMTNSHHGGFLSWWEYAG